MPSRSWAFFFGWEREERREKRLSLAPEKRSPPTPFWRQGVRPTWEFSVAMQQAIVSSFRAPGGLVRPT